MLLVYRMWENFWGGGILTNGIQFTKFSLPKYSGIIDRVPADSPKFSSPIALAVTIRQKFLPLKFSRVRYLMLLCGIVIPSDN